LDQQQLAEGAKNEFTEIRLNPKQMREMQDLFDLFDIDDSGSISKKVTFLF
jgi:Ca2+-binding EF-hand superfamily protein